MTLKISVRKFAFFTILLIAIFVFDQAFKYCTYFHIHAPVKVASLPFGVDVSIHLATNTGGPWGIFSAWQMPLLFLRICLCAAFLVYLYKAQISTYRQFCYTLILAGALGNIFDTLYYGFVVDMIHFTFSGNSFGIFNIADAAIFIGVLLSLFERRPKGHAATK